MVKVTIVPSIAQTKQGHGDGLMAGGATAAVTASAEANNQPHSQFSYNFHTYRLNQFSTKRWNSK